MLATSIISEVCFKEVFMSNGKLCLSILIFLFSLSPVTTYAFDLYAMGSYWDVKDGDETWGAGVGVSLPLITNYLRLDGRVYVFEENDLGRDDTLDLLPIDLGVQFHILPDEELDPYLLGGVSWVYADSEGFDVDSDFGGYLGAGLDMNLDSLLSPFVEVVYRFVELDSDVRFSRDNLEATGFTANVGLKLSF